MGKDEQFREKRGRGERGTHLFGNLVVVDSQRCLVRVRQLSVGGARLKGILQAALSVDVCEDCGERGENGLEVFEHGGQPRERSRRRRKGVPP